MQTAQMYPPNPSHPSGFYPPTSQVPPQQQQMFNGYQHPPNSQFPPQAYQQHLASSVAQPAQQPFVIPPQKGRQLITLSGPNSNVLNHNNNINGVVGHPPPPHHHPQAGHNGGPQQQLRQQRQGSPLSTAATNGNIQQQQQHDALLKPGMKRKPTDDSPNSPALTSSASSSSSSSAAPPSDEEYKKSTKHFLYHCDVCNFTCQGPGIYYHIVSPKHKTSCQKQGRAYIEPAGVLVGSRGPKKDRSTGQDYHSVDDQRNAGADAFEEDEVSYFDHSIEFSLTTKEVSLETLKFDRNI